MTTRPDRYGAEHRRLRRRYERVVRAGKARCWRCREWIDPAGPWHLGHADDGSYIGAGPEHVSCNLSDGGRKRAAQLYGQQIQPAPSKAPAPRLWSDQYGGLRRGMVRDWQDLSHERTTR